MNRIKEEMLSQSVTIRVKLGGAWPMMTLSTDYETGLTEDQWNRFSDEEKEEIKQEAINALVTADIIL